MPDDGRSISRNVASLNILVHDVKTYCIMNKTSKNIFTYKQVIDRQFVRIDPNDPNKLLRMTLLQRISNKGHMDQWQKNNVYKTKGRKQYICCLLQYQIFKAQERINDKE